MGPSHKKIKVVTGYLSIIGVGLSIVCRERIPTVECR